MQICAFLAQSNARVASLASKESAAGAGVAGGMADPVPPAPAPVDDDDEIRRKKAARAYENLKAFHAKKGWSGGQQAPALPNLS